MGLDISVYRQLLKDEEEVAGSIRIYVNSDFPDRADGLQDAFYSSAYASFEFRAGSYSGYTNWREELAKLAGYPAIVDDDRKPHSRGAWQSTSGPFFELINFSDCEGTIGPSTCAKLLKDFIDFDERAEKIGGWFYDRYKLWNKAMLMAADGGAVCFH